MTCLFGDSFVRGCSKSDGPMPAFQQLADESEPRMKCLAGRRGMKKQNRDQIMELRIYGLPGDTDIDALAHKALDTAAMLEEMGTFDQRAYEPAHVFCPGGKGDK